MPRVERTLALYAIILALAGGMFVLLFWLMGAINLGYQQGLIFEMQLGGIGRWLYYAYPIVLIVAALGSILLYAGKQEAPAIGLAGLPVAGTILYYLVLTAMTGHV